MSDKDRDLRDRAIEETIKRAQRPEGEGGGIKPPAEESLHDIIQRKMSERLKAASRKDPRRAR